MTDIAGANRDPGDASIETTIEFPDDHLILSSIEIISVLRPDGSTANYVRWQGTGDIVKQLGMLEYAKLELYHDEENSTP